jgi:hypothetical protein
VDSAVIEVGWRAKARTDVGTRLCNQVKHNLKDRRERKRIKENKTHKAATSALISDSTDEFKASLGQQRRRAGKEQLIVTALRASTVVFKSLLPGCDLLPQDSNFGFRK